MRAGEMRERIQFQKPVVTGSGDTRTVTWTDDFVVHARVIRSSELVCEFTIRYKTGITPESHRIIWEGRTWNITSPPHDIKKRQLVIIADEVPLVDSTDIDSDTTEYVNAVPILRPSSS